jgi:phosphoribosylaminoimidazole (AIR) synthetase
MGVGLVMVMAEDQIEHAYQALKEYPTFKMYEIGRVITGEKEVKILGN